MGESQERWHQLIDLVAGVLQRDYEGLVEVKMARKDQILSFKFWLVFHTVQYCLIGMYF